MNISETELFKLNIRLHNNLEWMDFNFIFRKKFQGKIGNLMVKSE